MVLQRDVDKADGPTPGCGPTELGTESAMEPGYAFGHGFAVGPDLILDGIERLGDGHRDESVKR
jgi:hypothetical protein